MTFFLRSNSNASACRARAYLASTAVCCMTCLQHRKNSPVLCFVAVSYMGPKKGLQGVAVDSRSAIFFSRYRVFFDDVRVPLHLFIVCPRSRYVLFMRLKNKSDSASFRAKKMKRLSCYLIYINFFCPDFAPTSMCGQHYGYFRSG